MLLEDIRQAFNALRGNLLRAALTLVIIAIGIMALVGILTAIDAIENSVASNMTELGAVSFEVETRSSRGRHSRAEKSKNFAPFTKREAFLSKKYLEPHALISLYSDNITGTLQVKHRGRATNPNVPVFGADENYLVAKQRKLAFGRGFFKREIRESENVAIIGPEIRESLFGKEPGIGRTVYARGKPYIVIGVLEESGGVLGGGGSDRQFIIPITTAEKLAGEQISFRITGLADSPEALDEVMGTATAMLRNVRGDRPGRPDSFRINKSESLLEALNTITGRLKWGGLVIGIVTLLGAAIGLTNIMLVSVTERTKEIGLRKSLGASARRIQNQFLTEAIVVTFSGGLAGVILGLVAGNLVSLLFGSFQFVLPVVWLSVGIVLSIVTGLAAGFFPARKAAKLDPVEALRYEG